MATQNSFFVELHDVLIICLFVLENKLSIYLSIKCNPLNICAVFYQISTDSASRGPSATAGLLVWSAERSVCDRGGSCKLHGHGHRLMNLFTHSFRFK